MTFKVSTSEVATFLTCKQRWMYAHHPSYNLEPRTLGVALTRGVIGHAALEVYYKALMKGESFDEAESKSQGYIMSEAVKALNLGDPEKSKMVSSLGIILRDYYVETKPMLDTYEIVGVENLVSAPLPGTDEIDFVGRVDLTLQVNSGPNRNETVPLDHKFSYNFHPEMAIKMNAQISNYIWALREMGRRSRMGIINMLRYRENAKENFRQEEVYTKSVIRNNFIINHVEAAKQIVDLKHKPKVGLAEGITRSTSKFNCEYCPFANLCYTEVQGLDSELMVKASFRPNSYGYDNVLDVE